MPCNCMNEIFKRKNEIPIDLWSIESFETYRKFNFLIAIRNKLDINLIGRGFRVGYVSLPFCKTLLKWNEDNIPIKAYGGINFFDQYHWIKGQLNLSCKCFWLGFECYHAGDRGEKEPEDFGIVRSYNFTKKVCKSIINQIIIQKIK